MLHETSGLATYRVRFYERGNQPRIDLKVEASPVLQCQRTLEAFAFPIDARTQLELAADDADVELVADSREPVLVTDDKLDIHALVADELILAIPMVPMAPGSEPLPEVDKPERKNPFAKLAELKES